MTGLDANETVTNWAVSNTNLATVSNVVGSQTTITRIGSTNAIVDLSVTITNACGQNDIKTISVPLGSPAITNTTIYGPYDNQLINSASSLSVTAPIGVTQYYKWTINSFSNDCGCTTDSNGLITCPPGTTFPRFTSNNSSSLFTTVNTAGINWGNCAGYYIINCEAINTCGTSNFYTKSVTVFSNTGGGGGGNPCPESRMTLYPTPVKGGELNIVLPPPGDPCGEIPGYDGKIKQVGSQLNDVKIYDMQGNQIYATKIKGDKIQIDANFKKGIYILSVVTSEGKVKRETFSVD